MSQEEALNLRDILVRKDLEDGRPQAVTIDDGRIKITDKEARDFLQELTITDSLASDYAIRFLTFSPAPLSIYAKSVAADRLLSSVLEKILANQGLSNRSLSLTRRLKSAGIESCDLKDMIHIARVIQLYQSDIQSEDFINSLAQVLTLLHRKGALDKTVTAVDNLNRRGAVKVDNTIRPITHLDVLATINAVAAVEDFKSVIDRYHPESVAALIPYAHEVIRLGEFIVSGSILVISEKCSGGNAAEYDDKNNTLRLDYECTHGFLSFEKNPFPPLAIIHELVHAAQEHYGPSRKGDIYNRDRIAREPEAHATSSFYDISRHGLEARREFYLSEEGFSSETRETVKKMLDYFLGPKIFPYLDREYFSDINWNRHIFAWVSEVQKRLETDNREMPSLQPFEESYLKYQITAKIIKMFSSDDYAKLHARVAKLSPTQSFFAQLLFLESPHTDRQAPVKFYVLPEQIDLMMEDQNFNGGWLWGSSKSTQAMGDYKENMITQKVATVLLHENALQAAAYCAKYCKDFSKKGYDVLYLFQNLIIPAIEASERWIYDPRFFGL